MSGRTFLLQDWVTIRSSLASPFVQDPALWLDLAGFADVSCWIDVPEVTPPGGTSTNSVQIQMQTSPTPDDAYFQPLAPGTGTNPATFGVNYGTAAPFNLAAATPLVVRSAQSVLTNNLMRYLRWSIIPNGSGAWDLTFRIRAVANRSTVFVPTLLPGCQLWLRADIGVTLGPSANPSNVVQWNDQSGNGNNVSQSTTGLQPTYVPTSALNSQPALSFAQASKQVLFTPGTGPTLAGSAAMFAVVAPSGSFNNTRVLATSNFTSGSGGYYLGTTDSGGTKWRYIINNYWGTGGGSTSAGNYIVSANYISSGSSSAILYQNGTQVASNTGMTATPSSTSPLNVGGTTGDAFGNDYFNGLIAELLFYNRTLATAELTRVHRYLGARYGITVP